MTTLDCAYGSNDSITYETGQSALSFQSLFSTASIGAAGAEKIVGIGNGAFTGNYLLPNKNGTTTYVTLDVLDGTIVFGIESSNSSLAQEENLAKKMVPLVS